MQEHFEPAYIPMLKSRGFTPHPDNPPPATTCPHKLPCGLCNISHSPCSQLPTAPTPTTPVTLNDIETNFKGKDYTLKCTEKIYGSLFDGA